MRVLFLTKYPVEGPSDRYRVHQFVPFLEAHGMHCTVHSLIDSRTYGIKHAQGQRIRKSAALIRGLVRRFADVLSAQRYDAVFVLRECFPYGPPILERLLRTRRIPIIYDFDDAIYIRKSSYAHSALDRFKSIGKHAKIVAMADCVLAANESLAQNARQFNDHVRFIEAPEDISRMTLRPFEPSGDEVIIGWIGSPTTAKYLHQLDGVLRRLCQRFPNVELRVVGGDYAADGVRVRTLPWSLEKEVQLLQSFDIGLMPLPNEPWSLGKSGGKARQYMAVGVPPVASDIGFNRRLIDHEKTGFLVGYDERAWYDILARLVQDPNLRQRVGLAARQKIVQQYSIEVIGPKLIQAIRDTVLRFGNGRKTTLSGCPAPRPNCAVIQPIDA